MPESSASGPAAEDTQPGGPAAASMVAVAQLTAHPGNVREHLDLPAGFCASVAEGVRIPLLVTSDGNGGYVVIEGHRRLAAALKAGLAEVPCVLAPSAAGDQAGQLLDMAVANSEAHRKNFTPVEEAAALFAAHEAGANRTRIRKATGRKAEEVKTALKAGQISAGTREQAGGLAAQMSLDELALVAEFDGDPGAVGKILAAIRYGNNVEYTAERIRQDRAEAAEQQRIRTELEETGFAITEDIPPGGAYLTALAHKNQDLTPDAHAQCPGRGVLFRPWNKLVPVHYCADPAAHGHTFLFQATPAAPGSAGAGTGDGMGDRGPFPEPPGGAAPVADPAPDPGRTLVIEGNKAWAAAAEVRKKWVTQLLARRTAPPPVARFVTGQLLTMPEPLRRALPDAARRQLFTDLAGRDAAQAVEAAQTCPAARLPLLMLAPIVTAYESEIAGDVIRRNTWREDQFSPCPRADAGRYLAFLATLGYPLAPIEQAVADGVPYTGDNPTPPLSGSQDTDDDGAAPTAAGDSTPGPAADGGASPQDGAPDSGVRDGEAPGSEEPEAA